MTTRGNILSTAKHLTENERNKTYDEPFDNMTAFAHLLEGYFFSRGIIEPSSPSITPEDAANVMVLAKISRTVNRNLPYHEDNYIDAAAYTAIAGECAKREREDLVTEAPPFLRGQCPVLASEHQVGCGIFRGADCDCADAD